MPSPSVVYEPNERQWHGPTVPSGHLKQFYGHFLLHKLAAKPTDEIVQINDDTGHRMTAGTMHAKSLKIAEQLAERLTLRWGDRVCVAADQHDDLAALVLGLLVRGAVVNALHTGFTMLEFKHFLGLVCPKVVICEARNVVDIRTALLQLDQSTTTTIVTFGEVTGNADGVRISVSDLIIGYDTKPVRDVPPPQGQPDVQLAFIMCSSGTTGPAKGICVTHTMIILGMNIAWPALPGRAILNASTLFWGSYLVGLSALQFPGALRVITGRSPVTCDVVLDILVRRHIAHVFIGGPMVIGLMAALRAQPERLDGLRPHLRQIQTTGSSVSAYVYRVLDELLPAVRLNMAYGMSDVGGGLATSGLCGVYEDDGGPPVPGCSGRVCAGTTIRVIDETGRRCGPDEVGEFYVRKVCPFPGYLDSAETNRAAFDADGFLRTGDMGRVDGAGNVYVVGRCKDSFKHCDSKIVPSELEQFIESSFPAGVQTAVVVGVPDEALMFVPVAVVVRRPDVEPAVTADEIRAVIKENFSDAKQLRGGVLFVDALPRTSSNKVRRNVVQQWAEEFYARR